MGTRVQLLKQFPELEKLPRFDPKNLTAADVLSIFTLVLAETSGADGVAQLRAHAVMEQQFARGSRAGYELGKREGYEAGYREGLDDGRMEALENAAREEAERATIKAAATSRKLA